MEKAAELSRWVREHQQRVEDVLERLLPAGGPGAASLAAAMAYSALGGGKRIRPLLAYAAGELTGARVAAVDAVAAAVELVHVYSLIHDDLPCMDDDVLRRGKPTCHVQFDEATALLAGDALQSLAFESLLAAEHIAPARRSLLARRLAEAAGARGMAGGQAIDLASTGRSLDLDELETMHRLKTGAMIRAAVALGAACGDADETGLDALERFAGAIGLAFQVVDDVLDVEATAEQLGKTPGKDARQNKATYVSLLGIDAARARARVLHAEALGALAPLGGRARRLAELADWIVLRRN